MSDARGLFTISSARANKSPPGTGTTVPVALAVTADGRVVVAGTQDGAGIPIDPAAGDLTYSSYDLTTGAASGVVKVSAGTFVEMDGVNEGTQAIWVYLFNAISVPGNGSAIASQFVFALPVQPGQPFSLRIPKKFSTGLCWAASSTGNGTFTIGAGASTGTVTMHVEYN